jgi:DNA-binding transcriptional MerR regulator
VAHGSPPPVKTDKDRRYTLAQVCRLTGITPTVFSYYRKMGVLDPPDGKARNARYTWRHIHIAHQIVARRNLRRAPFDYPDTADGSPTP